ncbi:MAG: hypothetical protein ICV76_05695 [Nitrospiraceae bacterium]|nr:hypothetical protein [Nitrospiraceae bacterium]
MSDGRRDTPLVEWVAAGLGLLLLLGTLGFLGYKEFTETSTPPDVTVHVETIQPARTGYLVTIRAVNHGGQTAAGLWVSGTLRDGGTAVETSRARFQYVPAESERRGGLYFSRDPRALELSLRAEGYERP